MRFLSSDTSQRKPHYHVCAVTIQYGGGNCKKTIAVEMSIVYFLLPCGTMVLKITCVAMKSVTVVGNCTIHEKMSLAAKPAK